MVETSGSLRYTSTSQLADALGVRGEVPIWEVGTTPSFENVGTGDNTQSVFYLDQRHLLEDTLVLSFGANQRNFRRICLITFTELEKSAKLRFWSPLDPK